MSRNIKHRPGYTPQAAAARRAVRDIARKLGLSPRHLKRNFTAGYSGSAFWFRITDPAAKGVGLDRDFATFFSSDLGEVFEPPAITT